MVLAGRFGNFVDHRRKLGVRNRSCAQKFEQVGAGRIGQPHEFGKKSRIYLVQMLSFRMQSNEFNLRLTGPK
ncbi:MAG: hypothetical protein WBB85_17615, partial [Albidovulum sp.]|uniref:hypothetical protein n=1 Tax=Albidovulum sp. TaxID=1872424 RepID=UPI003CB2BFBE